MRGRGPSFGEVLGVREFRALWAAELLSILGDQLARVALALLVYRRTSSAALTALTYALTFAPAVLGGALLSGLADRYPRRLILVATDLIRAALAGAMAIPGLPLPALWIVVGVLSMAGAPFKAAQLALLPQILDGDRFVVGLSLRQVTGQGAQLAGFASGGLLLSAVEPHVALALNALTFVVSALLIMTGVRHRPAAAAKAIPTDPGQPTTPLTDIRPLVPLVVLMCLAGLFVVPEGVAAPYGAAIGVGSFGVGLLMAADPLGSVIGAWLLARIGIPPTRRSAVLLAAGSGVPLVLCASGPSVGVSIALWAVSGVFSTAYLIICQAMVVDLVPDHRRGRVLGRISTCLYTSQGLAILAGGFAAEATGPFRAVAEAGLLGSVLVLCVGEWWRRVARSRRDLAAGSERGSVAGERGSHILGRHDGHLLADNSEQKFEGRKKRSHVLGRHGGRLLPYRSEREFEEWQCRLHVLGRHDERLLPNRTQQVFADGEARSHVLGHDGHLLPNRTQQVFGDGEASSHVLGRHDGHLLPNMLAGTTSLTRSHELSLVRELSSGSRAFSLWVLRGSTLRNRMVLRRVATA